MAKTIRLLDVALDGTEMTSTQFSRWYKKEVVKQAIHLLSIEINESIEDSVTKSNIEIEGVEYELSLTPKNKTSVMSNIKNIFKGK